MVDEQRALHGSEINRLRPSQIAGANAILGR
jgi:hypothetical protein